MAVEIFCLFGLVLYTFPHLVVFEGTLFSDRPCSCLCRRKLVCVFLHNPAEAQKLFLAVVYNYLSVPKCNWLWSVLGVDSFCDLFLRC